MKTKILLVFAFLLAGISCKKDTPASPYPKDGLISYFGFNDTVLDTHNFADLTNNKIVFNSTTAGVYQINFGGKVGNSTANRIGYWIRKEGSMNTGPYIGYFEIGKTTSTYSYPTFNFIYQFNNGDFLELDMYHDQGSTLATYPASQAIGFFMSGFKIG